MTLKEKIRQIRWAFSSTDNRCAAVIQLEEEAAELESDLERHKRMVAEYRRLAPDANVCEHYRLEWCRPCRDALSPQAGDPPNQPAATGGSVAGGGAQ